jgi:hypothetical protein
MSEPSENIELTDNYAAGYRKGWGDAAARIGALEAALREIKDTTDDPDIAEIAYLALAPEQDK